MVSSTLLPGFENLTRDSQQTFRALLTAMAEPGRFCAITAELTPPAGLSIGCAAACLALLDFETIVWMQTELPEAIRNWLRFHTGCKFTDDKQKANFAVIGSPSTLDIRDFCWGSAEAPENSTTLLIQADQSQKSTVTLSGPGIANSRTVSCALPTAFWTQWQANHSAYPRGIDCFLFEERQVFGLPRTVRIEKGAS
ncbi:MAG: phosphonate C-P lyase system protein PhnH [Phormidesmis sp.]